MKLRFFVCLLAAAALLSFSACGDPGTGVYQMNNKADVTGLSISNAGNTSTVKATRIAQSIAGATFDNWDEDITGSSYGNISLNLEEDFIGARIRPTASRNAKVEWGIGDRTTRPGAFVDVRVPASFAPNDYLYLKVTSEDQQRVNYFRYYVAIANAVVNLSDVFLDKVGERRQEIAEGGATWQDAQEGSIELTAKQAGGVNIVAVGFDQTSTFEFSRVANLSGGKQDTVAPTTWQKGNRFSTLKDQDMLYIRVTAQNGSDQMYYKFLVSVSRITTIAKLEMGSGADFFEVLGIGFSSQTWTDVKLGAFADPNMPEEGYRIRITPEDPDATAAIYKVANANAAQPGVNDFVGSAKGTVTLGPQVFADNEILAIRVVSGNGFATAYYKIKINLLAANFATHPKSDYYYYFLEYVADDDPSYDKWEIYSPEGSTQAQFTALNTSLGKATVAPLSATLDRSIASFDYQWYESNSWYGGYGFDPYGHKTEPNNTMDGIPDSNFKADLWHTVKFDEKMNWSLFNGGNQSARYLFPGIKMEGAGSSGTGLSGTNVPGPTPVLDKRPILPGFTNESHYYWVEVTDKSNGRKVMSQRAVIVSERDNSKKHFIIDVNNTAVAGRMGTTGSFSAPRMGGFKNPVSFKEQYDEYYVDIKDIFPAGFNIMDYKTLTVQAKFYLVDGTEWTQNWTQGNVGFEGVAEEGSPEGRLVLYHNLTNDNGTYMLSGGSKEPLGADLSVTPNKLVVQPSGDHKKGDNKDGYPPLVPYVSTSVNPNVAFNRVGDLVAAQSIVGENMQGWFCGFVDIVELRFEGPPRD